jgi:hypothetical protein
MPNRYERNRAPLDDGDPHCSMAGSTRFDTTPQPTPWPNNPSRPAGHPDASMPVPTYIPDEWIFDVDDDTRATVRSSTKPPKSSLPKFDGNPMNWPMFIQSFKVQVHDTCLNDAERQHHLRNCLTTEIQQHLGQALLNPGLYRYSLVELHRKFGNPRIVSTACSTSLLKLQSFRDNDYTSLRSFASTLHSVVATLRLGGYGHELNSCTTLSQLVAKLPPILRSKWADVSYLIRDRLPNIVDFDSWLDDTSMAEYFVRAGATSSQDKQNDSNKTKEGKKRAI